jgi:hypothetical protein
MAYGSSAAVVCFIFRRFGYGFRSAFRHASHLAFQIAYHFYHVIQRKKKLKKKLSQQVLVPVIERLKPLASLSLLD